MFTFGLPGAKNGVVSIEKWFKLLGGGGGGGGGLECYQGASHALRCLRSEFQAYDTMQPAMYVVPFKYSNRFHPSVEQIHRRTERDFLVLPLLISLFVFVYTRIFSCHFRILFV